MKIYRLREAKTSQLRKLLNNGNITEDQFQIAYAFFKKYSAFEKEIDWNRGLKITWDDLKEVIYKERNSESQTKKKIKKGLEGFEEGKDYKVLEETDDYVAYQPFTWEASRMIASHYVEPSRNEDGEMKDARWCTAYQKDRSYWDDHNEKEAFVYICGKSIPTKKVAISISKKFKDTDDSGIFYHDDDLNFNIWDFEDNNDTIGEYELSEIIPSLYDFIEEAYNNWENRNKEDFLSKLKLNPETNRYDYDGNLTYRNLNSALAENGNGFTINFSEVTGNFDCSDMGLTSLKGAPQKVGGDFKCSYNKLSSLEGAPHEVGGGFYCYNNKLTSLEGAPKTVGGSFNCSGNQLTSLEGTPQTVGGSFNCSSNKLTSLEGAPKEASGYFDCSWNHLTSLEGAPKTVLYNFKCSNNNLTSLEGAPQKVGGDFICSHNELSSLEEAPKKVYGDFYCYDNLNLYSLDGIGEVKGKIHTYEDF